MQDNVQDDYFFISTFSLFKKTSRYFPFRIDKNVSFCYTIYERCKMTRIQLFQSTAENIFEGDNPVLTAEEYLTLIREAKTQEEKDFYSQMYNYLLAQKQKEVIANETY